MNVYVSYFVWLYSIPLRFVFLSIFLLRHFFSLR